MTKHATRHPAPAPGNPAIEAQLEALAAEQASVAERILALRAQIARGTGDVTEDAIAAAAEVRRAARPVLAVVGEPQPLASLAARLEGALRSAPRSIADLALDTGAPAGRVAAAMRALKSAGRVYNLGTEERPLWFWVVGDEGVTPELRAAVETILRVRPTTFAELLEATGARRGRVSGVIVELQREGAKIENHGDGRRARWFMPTARRHGVAKR